MMISFTVSWHLPKEISLTTWPDKWKHEEHDINHDDHYNIWKGSYLKLSLFWIAK